MNDEVYIVHTINPDLSVNEPIVFFDKSLARVCAWNYYMSNCFYADDAVDDWQSLLLDNEIYCDVDGVGSVKAIWITYHRVCAAIEPKITFTIDLNKKEDQ